MAGKKKQNYSPLLDNLFGRQEKAGRIVDWSQCDRTLIGDLVAVCSVAGVAVLFGFTRDRGAWALTFMGDILPPNPSGKRVQTVYCNSEDMLESWVSEWVENWSKIAQEGAEG